MMLVKHRIPVSCDCAAMQLTLLGGSCAWRSALQIPSRDPDAVLAFQKGAWDIESRPVAYSKHRYINRMEKDGNTAMNCQPSTLGAFRAHFTLVLIPSLAAPGAPGTDREMLQKVARISTI